MNEYIVIIFAPNTPFNNKYNAITVTNAGILAATTQLGSLVWDGEKYQNYIPSRYYTYYPSISNTVQFNYVSLLYNPGEKSPISMLEKENGHLLFCNSGSFSGYGTVIEIDIFTNQMNFYDETNNIIDQKIIRVLEKDARTSLRKISELVNVSLGTVSNRVKKMEKRGVIRGYSVILNPDQIGWELNVVIGLRIEKGRLIEIQEKIWVMWGH